jgi:hypothetical protein
VILTAAFLLFAALVIILCLMPLAEKMRKKQPAHTPTPQKAARN